MGILLAAASAANAKRDVDTKAITRSTPTVAWRDNRVFAEVSGAGPAGTSDPEDVIALAKKQDAHISKLID